MHGHGLCVFPLLLERIWTHVGIADRQASCQAASYISGFGMPLAKFPAPVSSGACCADAC